MGWFKKTEEEKSEEDEDTEEESEDEDPETVCNFQVNFDTETHTFMCALQDNNNDYCSCEGREKCPFWSGK